MPWRIPGAPSFHKASWLSLPLEETCFSWEDRYSHDLKKEPRALNVEFSEVLIFQGNRKLHRL